MPYFVSYQTKIKKSKNEWDILNQGAKYFFHFGNCLSYLNDNFNSTYEIYHNQEGFFAWTIQNEKDFFHGLFKIENTNFLEKVLKNIELKDCYHDKNTSTR
jgi:hypothetical protein